VLNGGQLMLMSWVEAVPVEDDQIACGASWQLARALHGTQAFIQVHSNALGHQASGFQAC